MRKIRSSSAKLKYVYRNWEGRSVAGHSTPTHRNETRKATKNISHCLSQSVFFCFSISSAFAFLRSIFLCVLPGVTYTLMKKP